MFNRILTVCVGNICRSPTAEVLLREKLHAPKFSISSAGISALVGEPIEPTALAILQARGHVTPEHQGRQLSREMLHAADVILAMERRHIEHILAMAPEVRGRTFLLGKWQNDLEIDDPYRKGDDAFLNAYEAILKNTSAWASRINR